nr:MAG TPA: hypothetical protein [Caudoviricetes sp.]DAJ13297.1 MAG TPA: hypothetical protein [Siphoviridae sp. ctX8T1]
MKPCLWYLNTLRQGLYFYGFIRDCMTKNYQNIILCVLL